jgi:hypothetical protein
VKNTLKFAVAIEEYCSGEGAIGRVLALMVGARIVADHVLTCHLRKSRGRKYQVGTRLVWR